MSIFSDMLSSEDYYINIWAYLASCRHRENKNDPYHRLVKTTSETKFCKCVKLDLTSYTIEITNWIAFPTTCKGPSDQPMVS